MAQPIIKPAILSEGLILSGEDDLIGKTGASIVKG